MVTKARVHHNVVISAAGNHNTRGESITREGPLHDIHRRDGVRMQHQLRDEEAQMLEMPSFEMSSSELIELQATFLSWWDGRCAPKRSVVATFWRLRAEGRHGRREPRFKHTQR